MFLSTEGYALDLSIVGLWIQLQGPVDLPVLISAVLNTIIAHLFCLVFVV